jgi:mannonate dehydratase
MLANASIQDAPALDGSPDWRCGGRISGLLRPFVVAHGWIPAFAGMTQLYPGWHSYSLVADLHADATLPALFVASFSILLVSPSRGRPRVARGRRWKRWEPAMEQTWRWFGPHDPVSLDHVKQAGATGIVTALHHIPVGQIWSPDEIAARKATIEASGLRWSVCESIPVDDAIKRGGAGARRSIDAWKDSLANLGRSGIEVVCYNFMPVVDWTRTDLAYALPTKGFALRFDIVDFVGYDVFVLRRPRGGDDYGPTLVARAERRIAAMSPEAVERLEHNIIAGLPGGAAAQTRETIATQIASFDGIGGGDMRENLKRFLGEVVPVAEQVGVRLALHPDDPPFSLFGLPRVVCTASDARYVLGMVDAPANGLTFCTGSYGARPDNDLTAMAREFAPRIHFAHLRNVAIESEGCFHEAEHLDGSADMVAIIEIMLREEQMAARAGRRPQIPMRPDHGHLLADDIGKASNPGYSYAGRLKGLAELRGVMHAVARQLPP